MVLNFPISIIFYNRLQRIVNICTVDSDSILQHKNHAIQIKAIESKKEREQEVEKQKAELERFTTEQQQKVELAKAESEAAKEQALKKRLLADAQAYEIEKINTAIGDNPNYVKLQALEALKAISKDPASKIYFMDGNSPSPLPLMNIGSK